MINVLVLCKNKWQWKCYGLMSLALEFIIFIQLVDFLTSERNFYVIILYQEASKGTNLLWLNDLSTCGSTTLISHNKDQHKRRVNDRLFLTNYVVYIEGHFLCQLIGLRFRLSFIISNTLRQAISSVCKALRYVGSKF